MRKQVLVQHIKDEGHGDPEEAGVNVKIQLKYPETDPNVDQIEWNALEIQNNNSLGIMNDNTVQTIMFSDESGRPVELQIITDPSHMNNEPMQFELYDTTPIDLNVIQAFGGNNDESLAALI